MYIPATNKYTDFVRLNTKTSVSQTATVPAGPAADRTSISQTARNLYASDARLANTINIADATAETANGASLASALPPLLLPNRQNVSALSEQIVEKLPRFMQQNDIPALP